MSNCLGFIDYSGHQFQYNYCSNIISYETSEDANFTKDSLLDLSKACFEAYKFRLSDISQNILDTGTEEYDLINEELIGLILPFDPLKFSFSISGDPSLHFFIRFAKNISLFIETYLDLEDGHDTYVQLLKSGDALLEVNCMFDEAIYRIQDILANEFSEKPFPYYNFLKDLKECPQYPQDLFQTKVR